MSAAFIPKSVQSIYITITPVQLKIFYIAAIPVPIGLPIPTAWLKASVMDKHAQTIVTYDLKSCEYMLKYRSSRKTLFLDHDFGYSFTFSSSLF